MNRKANVLGIVMVLLLFVLVVVVVLFAFGVITLPQATVQQTQETAQQVAQATKEGDVASLGVYVRSLSEDDINTKLAITTYCQDDKGEFVIDGTTSSITAEITGKTEIGRTVTCWAFDSTHQTLTPKSVVIDGESPHIVIDAYNTTASGRIQVYTDTLTTGSATGAGHVNVTVTAGQSDSFAKLRFKNNDTDMFIPLGGIYFETTSPSNISLIDITGSATLSGMDHTSTQIVSSTLATAVSSRRDNWDYVFEIDDDSSQTGNQAILLDENDYLETGAVVVESTDGCDSGVDAVNNGGRVITHGFLKGYYRSAIENSIKYGHENDATSSSVIGTDINGDTFYCNKD